MSSPKLTFWSFGSRKTRRHGMKDRHLRVESLERREMLSITPAISTVEVGGTEWTDTYRNYLRDHALGSEGFALETGRLQSRVLPWTNANQVRVQFNGPIQVDLESMVLRGAGSGTYDFASMVTYEQSNSVVWTLLRPLASDQYILNLDGDGLHAAASPEGLALDGDWITDVSSFPSGDGEPGGDFDFRFNVVVGDADRSGAVAPAAAVDISDLNLVRNTFGSDVDLRADLNGSGTIDVPDLNAVRNLFAEGLLLRAVDDVELHESSQLVSQAHFDVELGQASGSRRLQFSLNWQADMADGSSSVEDMLLVYLVDPETGATLLDRGIPGTAIFALRGARAEYLPGLVRFDGEHVEVDVSSLGSVERGRLLFQLVNHDRDTGGIARIHDIASTADPLRTTSSVPTDSDRLAPAGPAIDVSTLSAADGSAVIVQNVRVDTGTGRYIGELRLANNGSPTGRKAVVTFDGFPAGVRLTNASGTTATGAPYINLEPGMPNGGLGSGSLSQAVQFEIESSGLTRFPLQLNVFTGGANRPPILDPLQPVQVFPGQTVQVPLAAIDPDGDRIEYSMLSGDHLPQAMVSTSGFLELAPSPEQIGEYIITIVASDSVANAERQIAVSVLPDPLGTTRISGDVRDVDGTPLPGVPVSLSRITSITDANGRFSIELPNSLLPTEEFSIVVPVEDVFFDPQSTGTKTITFRRARFDTATGTSVNNPRRHTNLVSSFIDASIVYGSDDARASALRMHDGTGRLKFSPGDLLPFNNTIYFPDGPLENDVSGNTDPTSLFVGGDVRASENVALAALHIILMREHNRLAMELHAAEPTISDEAVYQRVRRVVNAEIQHVTYSEYLPLLLGSSAIPAYTGYDPTMDPETGAFFATGVFRLGHSQMVADLLRIGADGNPLPGGSLNLREAFSTSAPILADGIEPFLRGLVAQQAQQIDLQIVDELRNFLFGPPGSGGLDLPALTLQRGRDMGLPSYVQARVDLGLAPITTFSQISSNVQIQTRLQSLYGAVDKIDAFVGGLAEDHVPGAMVGEMFRTVLARQFQRSRDGDRFWYENGQFTESELGRIRATTLAQLIERNSSITGLPANVFTLGAPPQPPAPAGAAASGPVDEYRTLTGAGNNPLTPNLGATNQNLRIDTSLNYADGISAPNGQDRPNVRAVTNAVLAQETSVLDSAGATALTIFWGQILSHDLSLTPTGTSDVLKVHADQAQIDGQSYPFVAEKLKLLFERELYPGVDNVVSRPIYLPAIDLANAVTIDPAQDTMVTTDAIPGTALTVAAGTLEDREGQMFDGQISITAVPPELTPASLPMGLTPDLVVTIQPADMVFTTPAPISFPNRLGFAPGTEMDLWSINPVTGQFDIVGKALVREDGSSVDTVEGGIRNSSWHFVLPVRADADTDKWNCGDCCSGGSPPPPPPPPLPPGGGGDPGGWTSSCNIYSGEVVETHHLPGYQSNGQSRGVVLQYNSLRADARPIVHFGSNTDVPLRFVSDFRSGITVDDLEVSRGDFGAQFGDRTWLGETGAANSRVGVLLDLRQQPSGVYDYSAAVGTAALSGGVRVVSSGTVVSGKLRHVNSIDSQLGAGWGMWGLQEIVENPDGGVLLIDGGGSAWEFSPPPPSGSTFISEDGDFSTLTKLPDGTYRRVYTDQSIYQFNASNKLAFVRDRNGNETRYQYDDLDRLTSTIDPVGLATTFAYLGEKISTITDPAGRVTRLEYDGRGNLLRIIDADNEARTFTYDDAHHLTGEIDKLGRQETAVYDEAGRAREAHRKDGSVLRVIPASVRGLYPLNPTGTALAARANPVQAVYYGADGAPTTLSYDKSGSLLAVSDAAGQSTAREVDSDTRLPDAVRNGRNQETRFTYDSRGNITSIADAISDQTGTRPAQSELFYTARSLPDMVEFVVADVNLDGIQDAVGVSIEQFRLGIRGQDTKLFVRLGRGDGIFSDPFTISAPFAKDVAVGDVNGDALPDVVVATDTPLLFIGNGDGTFTQYAGATNLPAYLSRVEIVDMDGDGNQDVAAIANGIGVVTFGLGDGTFGNTVQLSDRSTLGLVVNDWDGDSLPDVMLSARNSNPASESALAFVNRGNRSFELSDELMGMGDSYFGIALDSADLNGDGHLDVVIANYLVTVLLGQGDGTFAPLPAFTPQSTIAHLEIGDGTGDGKSDLYLVASIQFFGWDARMIVYAGNGDGTFVEQPRSAINTPYELQMVDWNSDGALDMTIADAGIAFNNGAGTFRWFERDPENTVGLGYSPTLLATGDFDGDGSPDILVSPGSGEMGILFRNSDGSYRSVPSGIVRHYTATSPLEVGDFNNDGLDDVIYFVLAGFIDVRPRLGLSRGDGTFEERSLPSAGFSFGGDAAVGDFDGDGNLDAAMGVWTLLGNGDGTFDVLVGQDFGGPNSAVDVNQDGWDDLTFTRKFDEVAVALSRGDGTFASPTIVSGEFYPTYFVPADWDNDGDTDIFVGGAYAAWMLDLRADGSFDVRSVPGLDRGSMGAAADVDRDGYLDVIIGNSAQAVQIAFGSADGSLTPSANISIPNDPSINPHQGNYFAAGDWDQDGDVDLAISNPVHILENHAGGATARPKRFAYDPVFSQLVSATDELGREVLRDLDPNNGNVLRETQVVGQLDATAGENNDLITRFTYTPAGLLETVTDPMGRVMRHAYDPLGRRTSTTYAEGTSDAATKAFEYDAAGNLFAEIDENGNRTEYHYDVLNRLTRIVEADPDGDQGEQTSPVTEFGYDEAGNRVSTTDANQVITRYEYDALNRMTAIVDAEDHRTSYAYDAAGRLIATVDPLGHASRQVYDSRGRVVEAIDANGAVTRYRYDADDNLTMLTDPVGNRTRFVYDARGRQIREIDPLGHAIAYTYDAVDNLVKKLDRNGRETQFHYDDLDRLVGETWSDADGATIVNEVAYAYDAMGNLLSATDNQSAIAFTYDERDRVHTTDNAGTPFAPHVVLAYAYDDAGNVLSVTDTIEGQPGATTGYVYDHLNRLELLTQAGVNVAEKRVDFGYNALGQYRRLDRFSDLAGAQPVAHSTYSYDDLNRLDLLSHNNATDAVLSFFDLDYDASGRINQITDIDGLTDYSYDDRGQLRSADHSNPALPDEFYDYDANGNRVASYRHGDEYRTGPANRLLSDGVYSYEYDDEGNLRTQRHLLTGVRREYVWDHRNRLVEVSDRTFAGVTQQTVRFTYDTFGRRLLKSVNLSSEIGIEPVVVQLVHDRDDGLMEFLDRDGEGVLPIELAARFFQAPSIDGSFAAEPQDDAVQWPLMDHLGTTRDTIDSQSALNAHFQLDTFGALVNPPNGAAAYYRYFTGRYIEAELGWYNLRNRYYDPAIGRFVSEDPIGFFGRDTNLHRYVNNEVVSSIDPTGLASHPAAEARGDNSGSTDSEKRDSSPKSSILSDLRNWILNRCSTEKSGCTLSESKSTRIDVIYPDKDQFGENAPSARIGIRCTIK